jgi:phage terminase large subunit
MPEIKINAVYQQLFKAGGLRDDCRYFEVYGGRRSGKSHDVVQAISLTALSQPRHFVPIIRKVGATIKDSVYAEYLDFFTRNNIPVQVNKTDKEITLPNGSRIRGFGLDDAEKLKSLKGATIIHVEEANEITEADFDSIDAGLSPNQYPGRIFLTHNPVPQIPGSLHWIQARFLQHPHELSKVSIIETPTGRALVLRTWYKDNAFCPEATKRVLEGYKDTNPEKYKLWALGEFTKLEGVVFRNWDIVSCVPGEVYPESLGIGLDFGFSGDPTAAVRVWVRESTREIWLQQLVYSTDLYNTDIYNALKAAGVGPYEEVTADSARPDIIGDLYRMGLNGIKGVKKYSGYKEDIAMRLQGYQIHVTEESTDIIKELSTYSWARDKNGKQLPKLQDGDDHGIDGFIMKMAMHTGERSILDVIT